MPSEMTEEDWDKFSEAMRELDLQWQSMRNAIADSMAGMQNWFNKNKDLINKLQKAFYCPKCGHHKDQHVATGCNHGRGTWAECVCKETFPS